MRRVNYAEVLCGLLHDIGKPILRCKMRVDQGVEKREVEEETLKAIEEAYSEAKTHELLGERVLGRIGVRLEVCRLFEQVVREADAIAAAERGLGGYACLQSIWSEVEEKIGKILGGKVGQGYSHSLAPMISPLWVLETTGYARHVGVCSDRGYMSDTAIESMHEVFRQVVGSLDGCDSVSIATSVSKLIGGLLDKPLWLPPRVLRSDSIKRLKPASYIDAQKETRYCEIARDLIRGLELALLFYKGASGRGMTETVGEILKYTVLTVPAAVYLALLPDTSLYSHSKTTAAYVAALSLGAERFRLLVVDARGIQSFVASPVAAKAASRVIRGRSFLAELLSLSILNYILESYGGLPYANVVTSEGGTLTILVPELGEEVETRILDSIRRAVKTAYGGMRGLWFTVALSRPFTLKDADFIESLKQCRRTGSGKLECGGFFQVNEGVERELAMMKSLDESEAWVEIDELDVEGFDAITREVVTRDEVTDGFGLRVESSTLSYASLISGGKLEEGDLVSETTHLSLAAGSALRNMSFLISVYAYEAADSLKPAESVAREVLDAVREAIGKKIGRTVQSYELYFKSVSHRGIGFNVALVPLPYLGSIHVMIAPEVPEYGDRLPGLNLRRMAASLVSEILREIAQKAEKHKPAIEVGGLLVRVEIREVNVGYEFVDLLREGSLRSATQELLGMGVDVYVGTMHTGTHHPFETIKEAEEGERKIADIKLVDLDTYDLIGMAKVDADWLGEVRKLLSFSPTRLSTLSDMLSMLIAVKTHLMSLDLPPGMTERGPIMLYAGGDDVSFYGRWLDVITFLDRLYTEVFSSLYPLSFTSAVTLAKGDYPLLELYDKTVRALEEGKREARGYAYLPDIASPRLEACGSTYKIVRGLKPALDAGSPLETLHFTARILKSMDEDEEKTGAGADYRREMMTLSRIAALSERELEELKVALAGAGPLDVKQAYNLMRKLVALSYLSSRRREDIEKLEEALSSIAGQGATIRLGHKPGDNVFESLKRLANSKTSIDLILLFLTQRQKEQRKAG